MNIGFLGAGPVTRSVAAAAVGAGHDVALSTRRGPQALAADIERFNGNARAVTMLEAATSDIVVLAVPWTAAPSVLDSVGDLSGRILIDATNPFASTDPLVLDDLGGQSSSVILARRASGATVVKAFNSLTMIDFDRGPREGPARRVLFVSGDDANAKTAVCEMIDSLGYAVIDLGGLDEGGRLQQAGGPLAGRDLLLNIHS